ncbi:MAG: hypothetical protein AAF773_09740 [Cyanobacteria bacterium P01_D01_bin.115]
MPYPLQRLNSPLRDRAPMPPCRHAALHQSTSRPRLSWLAIAALPGVVFDV